MKPVIQKIYVLLSRKDGQQRMEEFSQSIRKLFYNANINCNLYLITASLPESMPQVKLIHAEVCDFLKEHRFARLYVHFVHPAPKADMEDIKVCYQHLKLECQHFDQEGYMHQELPRLMLLPIIVPDSQADLTAIINLFAWFKNSFLLPSIYLAGDTFFLAQPENLLAVAEKIYYAPGSGRDSRDIISGLCYRDVLDDSLDKLDADPCLLHDPCPAAVIISTEKGMVYGCINRFCKKDGLGSIFEKIGLSGLMARYYEQRNSEKSCLACRERAVETFATLPLPEQKRHEIGALLYHFGTLHQGAEEHVDAIEKYKQSLKLSPLQEEGSICFRLGLSYTKAGLYEPALAAFQKAEPAYCERYYFYFYVGLCYFEKGDYGEAIERFSKAISLEPEGEDLVRILIYMGTCYNNLGKYTEAVAYLERGKLISPELKELYNTLGFSYFQLRDYDKAIENLSKAIELDPHSAIDYASLGASYREKGEAGKAIAMYEKALTLDPAMSSALENLRKLKKSNA